MKHSLTLINNALQEDWDDESEDEDEDDKDRKSTRLNSSHSGESRMPSSA